MVVSASGTTNAASKIWGTRSHCYNDSAPSAQRYHDRTKLMVQTNDDLHDEEMLDRLLAHHVLSIGAEFVGVRFRRQFKVGARCGSRRLAAAARRRPRRRARLPVAAPPAEGPGRDPRR